MRKKLAIFCDGTWNDLRMSDRTNVSRLAKCVAPHHRTGAQQIVFYDEGVGVGAGVSKFTDELAKLWGGAFGRGLDRKIEAAYRFLVLNYQPADGSEPGDDIYIFGFSRGAYTAQKFCGLIRKCGILKRDCFDQIPKAMEMYRSSLHPRDPTMVEFRARFAHSMASGPEDYERLEIREESPRPAEALADLYQYRPQRSYRMMFVGLWDTVGSMGVPDRFKLLSIFNRKYDFHDTDASSLISSLRHAVSIDEDRRVFSSTPVTNINELNQAWATATGWKVHPSMAADPDYVAYNWRPYQERWYPGDHGAVGGGNPQPGLSSHTLLWMAKGAELAGLDMRWETQNELGKAFTLQNACAEWRVKKDGTPKRTNERDVLGRIGGFRPRTGPRRPDEAGLSTLERWCRDDRYRPKNLTVLKGLVCPLPGTPVGEPDAPAGFPPA